MPIHPPKLLLTEKLEEITHMADFYMLQAPLACMLIGEGDKEEEMVLKKDSHSLLQWKSRWLNIWLICTNLRAIVRERRISSSDNLF